MERKQTLLEKLSTALNDDSQGTWEGSSIRSSLQRIGAQIDELPNPPNDDFDFEAKEDRLTVWATDLD